MVLQTAKNNQYRYYKCSARISKGDTVCKTNSYPVDKLEKLVLDVFKNQIYTPKYIKAVIDDLRRQTSKSGSEDQQRVKKLESELKEIEQAETKLYEAIEKGILELDGRLKVRVQQHKTRREIITAELADLQRKHHTPMLQTLTPQKIEAAARVLNEGASPVSNAVQPRLSEGHAQGNSSGGRFFEA